MPHRYPEDRRAAMADWRRRANTPAYMRWLGARRKLRIETGDALREAAEAALAAENGYAAALILQGALDVVRARERELGNRFDHERDEAFWEEAPRSGPLPRRG